MYTTEMKILMSFALLYITLIGNWAESLSNSWE